MKKLEGLGARTIWVGAAGLVVAVVAVVLVINSLGGSDETPSGAGVLSEAQLLEEMNGLEKAYLQIEIYSPIPGEASQLANSGALTPLPPG